jgi:hypothetical protein
MFPTDPKIKTESGTKRAFIVFLQIFKYTCLQGAYDKSAAY